MATHPKGSKYILSASINPEVGSVVDKNFEEKGVKKSFQVEQALIQYFGLDDLKNGEGPKGSHQRPKHHLVRFLQQYHTHTQHRSSPEADSLTDMTTDGSRIRRGAVDTNG